MREEHLTGGAGDVSRRSMLRKSAAGAGLGAAAIAAPSITGLSVAPLFASAQSGCVENLTTDLTVRITNPNLNVDTTVMFSGVVVDNGDGTCTVSIDVPADPDQPNVEVTINVTLTTGDTFTDTFNPQAGGSIAGTFSCPPNTDITIMGITGAAGPFPLTFEVLAQDIIRVCA